MRIGITPKFAVVFFLGFVIFIVGLFIEGSYEWKYGYWNYSTMICILVMAISCLFLNFEKEEDYFKDEVLQ